MSKRNIEARDKRLAAFHEAGHCVAAQHFGLACDAYILRIGEPTLENKAYVGRTSYQRTTPFRKAVIGWAGLIVEYLAHESPINDWPNACVEDFADYEDSVPDDHSATDNEALNAHPQRWRAMKLAWRIIIEHRHEVAGIAEALLIRYRRQKRHAAVMQNPMLRRFPSPDT
jgi:hypothetical protein